MTTDIRPDAHLDEDRLLAIVLGWEIDEHDDGAVRHLETCDSCTARAAGLGRRTQEVLDLISSIELPSSFRRPVLQRSVSATGRTTGGRRAGAGWERTRGTFGWGALARAAMLTLVLAGAAVAAVPALRQPVLRWAGAGWEALIGRTHSAAPTAAPGGTESPEVHGSTLVFDVSARTLRLELDHVQQAGSVRVRRTDAERVSLHVAGARLGETPRIGPSGVRIANRPESAANYVLEVPASIERVHVRIGGAPAIVLEGEALEAGFVWP